MTDTSTGYLTCVVCQNYPAVVPCITTNGRPLCWHCWPVAANSNSWTVPVDNSVPANDPSGMPS